MTTCLMYAMALGAVLGGMDYMLGNRFGLGQRFEEAFRLLGSIALSMAGILCLGPVLSRHRCSGMLCHWHRPGNCGQYSGY